MDMMVSSGKFDKACSTDDDFRIEMEDYVSSSQWKMKQIELILNALVHNKFVSLSRPKSHSIVSSIYSQERPKRRSRHMHCHNIKHHHHHHSNLGNHHKACHHSEHSGNHGNHNKHCGCHGNRCHSENRPDDEENIIHSREDVARIQQWSSETSDPQLFREGVRDGKIRRKKKRKRRRAGAGGGRGQVIMLDPNDLPKRAKWTIIITAGLLLLTCMLLVGITLRMAPIIDQMVRNQNEELLNSLNRQELNESMYLLVGR